MKIKKNALIRSYAQSMGIEAAKDLITKKIKSAALEEKEHYTEEETAKICGELIKEGGLIRIVAQNFMVQLERKRSEEQALLLDNIETQIWYLRDIETYGAVNKAHAEFLGLEKEKLEGRDLYDIISAVEAEVCIANNREVFEKKKQSHTEEWVKNGRGKTRLLSITRTPKIDDNGNVEYVICAAEDITDRKQAEKRIEHLNSVLKAIRSVNQMVVVEKDRDSLLQKACNALVEARGYDAAWLGFLSNGETFATVKGSGFREDIARFSEHVMGGDYPPCIRNALAQQEKLVVVDKSRECGDCFFKSACAGNEAAIIRVEYTGRLFGLLATLFAPDVTADEEEKGLLREVAGDLGFAFYNMELEKDRKRAEEMLRESEETFKAISVAANDGIIMIDNEGKVAYWNKAAKKIFGYTDEEILGKELRSILVPKRFHEAFETGFSKFKMTGQGAFVWKTLELAAVKKDGVEFPTELSMSAVKIGGKWNAIGLVRDITKRKQAEEALRNSEKRLAQAVQGISIPTFIIDNNHTITHWNKSCEKLTGISAAEIVGTQKAWSAFYAEERPVMADFIADGATEEEIAERYEGKHIKSTLIEGAYEGENFYPDLGEKGKWLFFTAAPLIDQQGKIVGAIETFQDITEQRSMEKQLRQSQKMEAIGTLAGGIAHDFNNLLTVIIGIAQLVLMTAGKDESLRKKIEQIEKAGERAASLTRQLLAFSRKQIIKPQVLDLNEEINETEKMLKRVIGEDIEFQTVLEPELWKVYADSGQINQVIINMVVNAKDAMSQGGKLTIETANADLVKNYFRERGIEERPGHYVVLAISDTGNGMDKETLEHIFEPFFTTKEVGKGTGLGLSTVYGIVKQNNGFIWVYSEPGQGTTFKVYLPKVKGVAEPEEKEQTTVDDLSGSETVLIVEDDDGLRKLAQEVLQSYGYRILSAENGEEALKVGKEHEGQIDLMITDVVMPKMGGKEAADRLQPLYPQMKVIYMSGYTDNAITRHGVLAPGLNFLEKPFTPEGLAHKVREALGSEK